jgi:hypothetical protein
LNVALGEQVRAFEAECGAPTWRPEASGELVALCGLNIESAAKIEESFEDRPMIGTLEIDHASTWETARNSAIRNFTKQVAILWPLSKTRPMKLAATTICP